MNDVLLVFAKVPRPGTVKTRLTPVLTPEEAARLYAAFLRDALQLYQQLDVDVCLYLAPPPPDQPLEGVPSTVTVRKQRGDGLGSRMQHAFREVFHEGYDRATVIGTDHPTLPLAFVRQSFAVLEDSSSICIGPTEDGGFYLLGMNAFYPHLFEGMTYSHSNVFSDTLARVESTDARLTILPQWYDVDTPEELRRMLAELASSPIEAPKTRRVVEALELESLE